MREKNATPHAAVSRPYLCATAASCHATDRREPKDKAGRRRERGRRHAGRRKARTPPLPRSRILVPDTQPVDLGSHSATPVTATPPLSAATDTSYPRPRPLDRAPPHNCPPAYDGKVTMGRARAEQADGPECVSDTLCASHQMRRGV